MKADRNVPSNFSFFYQNVRGMRTKSKLIMRNVGTCVFDVIIFTETWLGSEIYSHEFFPKKFDVFRYDRTVSRGGGVLIAVNSETMSSELYDTDGHESLEHVCVKVSLGKKRLFIYAYYIPPSSPKTVYESHLDTISCIKTGESDMLLVVGDANLPNITWKRDKKIDNVFNPFAPSSVIAQCFIDGLQGSNLRQLNYLENEAKNILDLCFFNEPEIMNLKEESSSLSYPIDSSHKHFSMNLSIDAKVSNNAGWVHVFAYERADLVRMKQLLVDIDVAELERITDIDEAFDYFYEEMTRIIEMCVPRKRKWLENKKQPWEFDPILRNLRNRKRKAIKALNKLNTDENKARLDEICQRYDETYAMIHEDYIEGLQVSFSENPRRFWDYVNSKKKSNRFPAKLYWGEREASTDIDKANLFADFFKSVHENDMTDISNDVNIIINQCSIDDRDISVSIDDIMKAVRNLNIRKPSGFDVIAPVIYRECIEEISCMLAILFKKSLEGSIFPDCLKMSSISPIFKSGDRKLVENYRSVSVAPTMSKIFETVILAKWRDKIDSQINKYQHGFIRGKSTQTNLLTIVSDIGNSLIRGRETHIVFTDFMKAFDKTNHVILLKKFASLGFDKRAVAWLSSFLRGRKNVVKMNNGESIAFTPGSGVPAGCVISATLFNVFINDITDNIVDVGVLLYADDLKIYRAVESEEDMRLIQSALNEIEKWCDDNKLCMNVKKLKTMACFRTRNRSYEPHYLYKGTQICETTSHKDLGLIIDVKMSFNEHMEYAKGKALNALGFIRRFAMKTFSMNVIKMLFCSLVRSHLEYACAIWSPLYANRIGEIESVQKKFTLYALNCRRDPITFKFTPYADRCTQMGLESLTKRRKMLSIFLLYDIITKHLNVPDLLTKLSFNENTRRTRNYEFIKILTFKTNFALNQPIVRMSILFNDIYDLYNSSVSRESFRNKVRKKAFNA